MTLALVGLGMIAIVVVSPGHVFAGALGAAMIGVGVAIFVPLERSARLIAGVLRDDPGRIKAITKERSLLGSGPDRTITVVELDDGTRATLGGPRIEILREELASLQRT